MGLSPEITVMISPSSIQFQWKESHLSLVPYVNIDLRKMAPVQIGEKAEIPGTVLVGVFDPQSELPSYPDKFPILQMIF